MTDFQIISLGKDCIPRTFLTNAGIIQTKSDGRLSMPFDLACHTAQSIAQNINSNFEKYLENIEYKYDENLSNKCWINPNGDFYPHDNDCKTYEKIGRAHV